MQRIQPCADVACAALPRDDFNAARLDARGIFQGNKRIERKSSSVFVVHWKIGSSYVVLPPHTDRVARINGRRVQLFGRQRLRPIRRTGRRAGVCTEGDSGNGPALRAIGVERRARVCHQVDRRLDDYVVLCARVREVVADGLDAAPLHFVGPQQRGNSDVGPDHGAGNCTEKGFSR